MKNYDLYRRHLPHYRAKGATYFVTWRSQTFSGFMTPDERTIVLNALHHFDAQRYDLIAWVVMNDHVHVMVRPREGIALEDIIKSWKEFSAKRINELRGRSGPFWQGEYFDRIMRDDNEMQLTILYILGNPRKRWPDLQEYAWVGENELLARRLRPRTADGRKPRKD